MRYRSRLMLTALVAVVLAFPILSGPAPAGAVSCSPCNATVLEDLNLRAGPSLSDEVLLVMPTGAEVEWDNLQGAINGYVMVTYDGITGWAYSDYLLLFPGFATTTAALNLRAGASLDAGVLLVMPAGATVMTLGGPSNGYYAVRYQDQYSGWAHGDYLVLGESNPGGADRFSAGSFVAVDTDWLNMRNEPGLDGDVLDVLPYGTEGTVVEPSIEADGYYWHRVDFGSTYGSGWVAGEFLRFVSGGGDFAIGDTVMVIDGPLNYRAEPIVDAEVLEVLPEETEGGILDGPVYADGWTWYQLGIPGYGPDGATPGWVAGEFLGETPGS